MKKEEIIEALTGKKPDAASAPNNQLAFRPLTPSQMDKIKGIVSHNQTNQKTLAGIAEVISESLLNCEVSNAMKYTTIYVAKTLDIIGLRISYHGFAFNKKGVIRFMVGINPDGIVIAISNKHLGTEDDIFEKWPQGYSEQSVVEYAKSYCEEIVKSQKYLQKTFRENPEGMAEAIIKATDYVEEQA